MSDIERKMARGAAWMVLLRFVERGIGVVSTLVLARLLVPADFGVVAMAMSVYGALEIMTAFSFDLALIQNRHSTRAHYDTAWTFNVLFGLGLMAGLAALAWPTAHFYANPQVAPVMMVLGVAALVRGFENIGVIEFQRDLNLAQEFKIGITRKVIGFMVTVGAAMAWESYWALVAGILAQRFTSLVMTFGLHPYRPRFSLAARQELLSFTKWLALNNVLIFVVHRANDFIVGRFAGPGALGAYNVSYEVANLPTTELVFPIGRALFPGFSTMAHDKSQLKALYMQVLALIAWFTLPLSVGMILLAEPLVLVLLGEKWRQAIPLLQVLSAYGAIRSVTSNSGSVYLALGSPGTITKLTLLFLALLLPSSVWGTLQFGVLGAAGAVVFAAGLQSLVVTKSIADLLAIRWGEYLALVWRPVLGCGAIAWSIWSLDHALAAAGFGVLTRLVAGSLAGAVAYIATVGFLWAVNGRPQGTEAFLLSQLQKVWPKLRRT
jgi:PST family polysaccharide transporter